MAYELFICLPDGTPGMPVKTVADAFSRAGVSCTEELDNDAHWIVLQGFESTLELTVKGGLTTYAGFRFVTSDDPAVVEKVTAVFKGLGWEVMDDEGTL